MFLCSKMKTLHLQLEDRYSRLKEIRETLWNLESEALPSEMIERLGIDFYPLDVNTGATSDSVTPYFLPRVSFPSCRDLRADGELKDPTKLKDAIIRQGRNRGPYADFEKSCILHRFFPSCLVLAQTYYAVEQKGDLLHRVQSKE